MLDLVYLVFLSFVKFSVFYYVQILFGFIAVRLETPRECVIFVRKFYREKRMHPGAPPRNPGSPRAPHLRCFSLRQGYGRQAGRGSGKRKAFPGRQAVAKAMARTASRARLPKAFSQTLTRNPALRGVTRRLGLP